MSGDILVVTTGETEIEMLQHLGRPQMLLSIYPTIHRMGPYNKELLSPKCQTIKMRNPINLRFSILAKYQNHLRNSENITKLPCTQRSYYD